MLTLTPIVCVASALAISKLLDVYMSPIVPEAMVSEKKSEQSKNKSYPGIRDGSLRIMVVVTMAFLLCLFGWHSAYMTQTNYSSPSVVLATTNRDGSMHIIVIMVYFRMISVRLISGYDKIHLKMRELCLGGITGIK
jgi:dolichyl-diphosphooligosaccharide--protein glycosyltransferase